MNDRLKTPFKNEALRDFSLEKNRNFVAPAIAAWREVLPMTVPVVVDGEKITDLPSKKITSPGDHSLTMANYHEANQKLCDIALKSCEDNKKNWAHKFTTLQRAEILMKIADIMREKSNELCALLMLEVGKTVPEADGDVAEAIDFCEFYAREALRLEPSTKLGDYPGEDNRYSYRPRGTALVIAPWNFPLAILCGMAVAPLVCGNPVILKPAEQANVVAYEFYKIAIEAGVPAEVLHFLPGQGEDIGAYMLAHPQVHVISFTGSKAVGLEILNKANQLHADQKHIKRVIVEMGGKNVLIVDDDADLDEAVDCALKSAFGFQGQKCSALSRIIVLENHYETFKKRFVDGLASMKVGSVEELSSKVAAVIDQDSVDRLEKAYQNNKAKVAFRYKLSEELRSKGHYVPPTIFEESEHKGDLAFNEFFGPYVTLFRAKDLDQAIEWANSTDYALTGGIFSRSPKNIQRIKNELEVGNMYINRTITGALVNRQPFGGYKLSGAGGKAGGPDYMLNFLEPITISENTMRRGFAPEL